MNFSSRIVFSPFSLLFPSTIWPFLRFSVAVLAFRMAFLIVDVAATSSAGVSRTLGKDQNNSYQTFNLLKTNHFLFQTTMFWLYFGFMTCCLHGQKVYESDFHSTDVDHQHNVAHKSYLQIPRVPWGKEGSISYRRAPAGSSCYPADLSVTDSAAQPITSISLLHYDATLGTVHRLTWLHQSLNNRQLVSVFIWSEST